MGMSGVVNVLFCTRCGGCLVWWMSGVVDIWCGGCLVWWLSGVVDVLFNPWCGGCLVWWISGVVDVWCVRSLCGGCRTILVKEEKTWSDEDKDILPIYCWLSRLALFGQTAGWWGLILLWSIDHHWDHHHLFVINMMIIVIINMICISISPSLW